MRVLLGTRASAAMFAAALSIALATAAPASAASPIGPDGRIHGCYVAKGKKKGALRLLAPGKKCKRKKKKEKPIAWSVQGPAGAPGAQGPAGPAGPQGTAGGVDSQQLQSLVERIEQQEATIASLQATVSGLSTTVSGLLAQAAKLDGISAAELNAAVDGLAALTAVCDQATALTGQADDLRDAIAGLALGGTIPVGLVLDIPALPAALGAFTCPAF